MSIRLGDIAPDFVSETTEGKIKFHDWLGNSWGVLFSHPADFTPVCTTELGAVAKLRSEFDKRNVKVMALSADPLESHEKWIGDINETQKTKVNYPLIADIARKYDQMPQSVSNRLTAWSMNIRKHDRTHGNKLKKLLEDIVNYSLELYK